MGQVTALEVGSIGQIKLRLHWNLLFFIQWPWLIFSRDPALLFHYALACLCLFAWHELGHVVFARALGLRVYSVMLGGRGGECRHQYPQSAQQALLVSAGGLVFQFLALVIAGSLVWTLGNPAGGLGRAFADVFTWYNILLLLVNILPMRWADYVENDGYVMMLIIRHLWFAAENPYPKIQEQSMLLDSSQSLLAMGVGIPGDAQHGIEIFNDEATPMAFVVALFADFIGLSEREAAVMAIRIHNQGGAIIPCATAEEAQLLAQEILAESKSHGHALFCRAVSLAESPG